MPRRLLIVLALLALQAALVLLFVAPGRSPEPHGLPVGVVEPANALPRRAEIEVHRYADAAAARTAIREREIYGAVVPSEGRLLVASAASPVVAQMLRERLANGARTEDVVPVAAGDPRGAALNLLFLPLMIACFPLAALLGRTRLSRGRMLGAVLAFSVLSGLALTALLRAMDALPGSYLAVSGAVALVVAAVALTTAGLFRALGPAGIGLAALLLIVLGNPGSGNASAPELLPGVWRVTGQLLPPGAGGQAIRDTAYFDGHALAQPALVLAAWALLGATLILVGRWAPKAAPAPAPEPRVAVLA